MPGAEAITPATVEAGPSGRVGRLSLVSGNVSFRGSGKAAWTGAGVNYPVFTGEALRTGSQARAEIQIGDNTAGLSDGTELEMVNLSDRVAQIALSQGRIDLDLRGFRNGESFEIDLPRASVWLLTPGCYDIDAGAADQAARIAVFDGIARFVGVVVDLVVKAGDSAELSGSSPAAAATEPAGPDAFGEWCRLRDGDAFRLPVPHAVSRDMTGAVELASFGRWDSTPDYGQVWYPDEVPADWAPYRYGYWKWIAPWGWTWIDDQPWGFAPAHYGRWALIDERWAWVPGGWATHPFYAPAVVAFLGTPAVGLSYAEGNGPAIGWFPLAPNEVYWPSYTDNLDYVRDLNQGDVRDLEVIRMQQDGEPPLEVFDGHFANRRFATVVPRAVFLEGRAAAPALLTLPEQRLLNAPVLMGSPQIGPPELHPVVIAATAILRGGRRDAPRIFAAGRVWVRAGGETAAHAALLRGHGQVLQLHAAHLRVPAYTLAPHPRHIVLLRIARADSGTRRLAGLEPSRSRAGPLAQFGTKQRSTATGAHHMRRT